MKKDKSEIPEGWTSLLDDEVNEIDKEIEDLQKKKEEKEEIAKYRQKIKENEVLQRNNIDTYNSGQQKVIRKSFYKLLKYSVICLLIIIVGGIITFAFLVENDKLKSQVFCGDVKAECQVCSTCGNTTCEEQICNNICPNITCGNCIYNINSTNVNSS